MNKSRGVVSRLKFSRSLFLAIVVVLALVLLFYLFQLPSDDSKRLALRGRLLEKMGPQVFASSVMVNGFKTQYVEAGVQNVGVPVVLIHGAGEGAVSWYPVFSELAEKRRVVALDVLGYGESDKPHAAYDGAFYSEWLLNFLDAKGLKTVDLVGSSQGGAVALRFAAKYPSRVRKLVVVDPAGFASVPAPVLAHFALLNSFPTSLLADLSLSYLVKNSSRVDSSWLDYGVQVLRMPGGKNVFWDGQGKAVELFSDDELGQIQTPVLVVWGQDDGFFLVDAGRLKAEKMPRSQFVVLQDAGHLPFFDQPEAFSKAVISFLEAG